MKTKAFFTAIIAIILIILPACGASQAKIRPTSTPIANWKNVSAEKVELAIPDNYIGGDLSTELDIIVGRLREFGTMYQTHIDILNANPTPILLYAFVHDSGSSGCLTSVSISRENVDSAISLDAYIEAVYKMIPSSVEIISQENVKLSQYDTKKFILENTQGRITCNNLSYIIKNGNTFYSITYGTEKGDFDEYLPGFEQSATTINILP